MLSNLLNINNYCWRVAHFICFKAYPYLYKVRGVRSNLGIRDKTESFHDCLLCSMALYTVHYTLYTVHYTRHIIQCILYTKHFTVWNLQFTRYTKLFKVYSLDYALYSVQYTLYTHWHMDVSRCMVGCLSFYDFLLILYSQGLIAWSLKNVL